jgi:hypothetical protein
VGREKGEEGRKKIQNEKRMVKKGGGGTDKKNGKIEEKKKLRRREIKWRNIKNGLKENFSN